MEYKDSFILHVQYHGSWCSNDEKSVDPALSEYSSFSTKNVDNIYS